MAKYKRGDFSTCDALHSWRPKTVTTTEIIGQIHELNLEDRQILAKSIAEQLGISRERVDSIIPEDSDMRKLSAKWAPKCMNADEERLNKIWNFFRYARSKWFLSQLTKDETWLYHYDPETKQNQLMAT